MDSRIWALSFFTNTNHRNDQHCGCAFSFPIFFVWWCKNAKEKLPIQSHMNVKEAASSVDIKKYTTYIGGFVTTLFKNAASVWLIVQ